VRTRVRTAEELTDRCKSLLTGYEIAGGRTPISVVFSLSSPLALAHPWIHFDGLLAHLVLRDAIGDLYWSLPSRRPLDLEVPLPLARTGGMWHASVSQFPQGSPDWHSTTVYKRFDVQNSDLIREDRRKKINTSSGEFRGYMMSLPYRPVRSVTFFGRGDYEQIRGLLSSVTNLGKKAAYGYGEVQRAEIKRTREDWSLVRDGVAMRPIPTRLLEEWDDSVLVAWRPPYWDKRNVEPCAPPGAHIVLRGDL